MQEFIEQFITIYLPLILAAWPVLAFIATITPTQVDNKALAVLRKILDFIAFNFGKAKNEQLNQKPKGKQPR